MAKKKLNIKVDTINSLNKPEGTIKQLDSVFFTVEVTELGQKKDLTSQQVKLFAKKSDGKIVEQTTGISITDATNGQLTIDLLNAAVQVPGYVYFELEISDNGGAISTANFIYKVISKVGSDEAIESTNEVATLKKIEEYVAQAKVELKKFKELQVAMLETNNSLNNQEEGRVEAESLRVTAEEGRVAAETKREEAFNKFEGRITANTEELELARTATTGEEFNSLDERIDCEVDRLNRKIEISFLQQEGKESHAIENTVEGMTTDTLINGYTLKNLFNAESIQQSDNIINSNGLIDLNVNSNSMINYSKAHVKDKQIYTIICNVTENTLTSMTRNTVRLIRPESYGVGVFLPEGFTTGIFKTTFTTNKEQASAWNEENSNIYITNSTGRLKFSLIILEGEINFIPSHFNGIESFGQKERKISSLSHGKNFFDKKQFSQYLNEETLEFKVEGNDTTNNFFHIYTEKKATSQAIFRGFDTTEKEFTTVNQEKYYILIGINGNKKDLKIWGEIILPKNTTCFYSSINEKDSGYVKFKNIQIELGKSKTTYESYKEYKKDIPLSKYGFDEGLRGIKSAKDELNSIVNNAIKKIEKYIFTGNEGWSTGPQGSETMLFYMPKTDIKKATKNILCNKFPDGSNIWNDVESGERIALDSGINVMIRIKKSKLRTQNVEGFKEWLRENETIIYYELANPIETPLTKNINLKTFEEKTYISFENSLSGTSSFKTPVNAAATISRLSRENKALEEENKNLRQDFESTTLTLTDSDLELVKQNVDMDFRLMEVEFALDIPQSILSSDINFKNKKGEVKTMARTPYEMMKIVILSGDYDREDYMHKVGKYYERGRMTKEEHDELMSLMTADEVLSK